MAAMIMSELNISSLNTDTSDDEEEEDDDDEDESDSDYDVGGCEESGLGLLARFAASALPVSSPPLSLLHDGKHRSRQNTLGNSTDLKELYVTQYPVCTGVM